MENSHRQYWQFQGNLILDAVLLNVKFVLNIRLDRFSCHDDIEWHGSVWQMT